MRLFLFVTAFLLSSQLSAQDFRIYPDFYDSVGVDSFAFHVIGEATFNDSMLLEVKLLSNDSLPTELFAATHDFTNPSGDSIAGFVYDPQTQVFSFPLGLYTSKEMQLWIRSFVGSVIREEILVIHFD